MLYFRLARLTPYLAAYCIRDCRYRMSCVILLLMRDRAPFWVCWCRNLTIPYEGSVLLLFYLLLLALLFNMYCSSTEVRCCSSCTSLRLRAARAIIGLPLVGFGIAGCFGRRSRCLFPLPIGCRRPVPDACLTHACKYVAQAVSDAYRCSPEVFTVPCLFRQYHYSTVNSVCLLASCTMLTVLFR